MGGRGRKITLAFDRLLSKGSAKQLLIVVSLLIALFAISFGTLFFSSNDWIKYCYNKNIRPWIFPLYLLIDPNVFHELLYNTDKSITISNFTLFVSGLTFVAGILLFTGAFVSILTNVISRRVDNHLNGLIPYLKSGHYIIMGYDDMVPSIISDIFLKDSKTYVLLLTAVNAQIIREKLRKFFPNEQIKRIIINYGLRTSKEFYSDIHLEDSKQIFIVGLRSLPAHDAMNVECIDSICSYLEDGKKRKREKTTKRQTQEHVYSHNLKRITCVFEDIDTYAAFKTTEIFMRVKDLNIELIPYNFYMGWAKRVFIAKEYQGRRQETYAYPSIYGNGIAPNENKYVHLVFVGTTNFSVAFAMEAAHLLHFPNFDETTKRLKTRITFIEKNAEAEMAEFVTRNRHFFDVQSYYYRDLTSIEYGDEVLRHDLLSKDIGEHDFLDVEFEFVKGDIFSRQVQDVVGEWAKDNGQYLSVFLAMADQRENFMMGMNMPDEVYDNEIPVFIKQDRSDNLVTNLRKTDVNSVHNHCFVEDGRVKSAGRKGRYANIYPFGMCDMAYYMDENAIETAKLINFLYSKAENNRFKDEKEMSAILADRDPNEGTPDSKWGELSVREKWSNMYNAYNIPCKMACLRAMRGLEPGDISHDLDPLTEREIQVLAATEHNRWNVEKLLMGYRKAKPEEDKYEQEKLSSQEVKENKKFLFIHHDIRPYDDLDGVKQLDYEFVKYIPWILKMKKE